MITLFMFAGFIIVCCIAAAGLIASAQTTADAGQTGLMQSFEQDISA